MIPSILKEAYRKLLPRSVRVGIRSYRQEKERLAREQESRRKIELLLARGRPICLELGAGGRQMDGWVSVDLHPDSDLRLDLNQGLPFPEGSVRQIYASHLFEHFEYKRLIRLLTDCHRALEKNGWLKLAVPDARLYVEGYINPDDFDPDEYCVYEPAYSFHTEIDYLNYTAYMGGAHRYMFDDKNVVAILEDVGFRRTALRPYDDELDLPSRRYESLYAEGYK